MKHLAQNLIPRPSIVVVMGHIDHGKSKLLDYIRKTNVVEKEKGGITQHIGAYEVELKGKRVTFLDTPGHEAFSQMRLRGTKAADVAILVIASDEGIKPQTIEAYEAIKKAGIPFIIALNKIDKPNADPERIKSQLAENQIFVEGYGGTIPSVNISAKTGKGVDELLDIVLLLAEMEDLKANPNENGSGFVIESKLGQKRGISATLLIQNGTVKRGMFVLVGRAMAPVRIFEDFQGIPLEEATFSSPVKIIGFDIMPQVGEKFETFKTKKEAEERLKEIPPTDKTTIGVSSLEGIEEKIIVPLVIKTDVAGSLEALEQELKKLENEKVYINILKKDIGNISEDDIKIASSAENSIIVGFNVKIEPMTKNLAERFSINIFIADIIYKISEWLEEEIKKRRVMLVTETIVGKAKILKIFSITKNKQVIGGEVLEGKVVANGSYFKIIRNDSAIGQGDIKELQHNKVVVKEVNQGEQFGMMVESKIEITKGDIIEIIEKL
ncbi:MAG: translation initiation factor IF-2 [Patescibacteria group bacterium]